MVYKHRYYKLLKHVWDGTDIWVVEAKIKTKL